MYRKKNCAKCGKETKNKKFGSISCSTSYNNAERIKIEKDLNSEEYRKMLKEKGKRYREKHKQQIHDYSLSYIEKTRNKFFEMYGEQCVCCGEIEKSFLTLEHIIPRKITRGKDTGYRAMLKAIKEHRPDLYQVLCWNCNCGKIDGICPHKLKNK